MRKFASDKIAPIAEKVEQEEYFPREILAQVGRNQLLGAPFPVSEGGLGLGWCCEILAAEEVSAVSVATEMGQVGIGHSLLCPAINIRKRGRRGNFWLRSSQESGSVLWH